MFLISGAALGQTATPTETPTPTPTSPPWPMFQHDAAHSGRSAGPGPLIPLLEWSYATGSAVNSSPAIGGSGYVCVGGGDGNVYLIDSTGSLVWSYGAGGAIQASPLILNNADGSATICVGSQDNNVYAIGLDDSAPWSYASLLWMYETDGAVDSSAVPGPDGVIYVGSLDKNLYAIDSDGTLRWTFTTGYEIYSSPAVDSGGVIYFCSSDSNLYAVNSSGTRSWTYKIGLGGLQSSPTVDNASRNVYVGSNGYNVYALTSGGKLSWASPTGAVYSCTARGNDGKIYATSLDKALYAINSNGTLAWTYLTGGQVFSSVALDSAGKIYFGSDDARFYVLNSNGSIFWSFMAGGKIESSAAIGSDGRVYVGSQDRNVYCIGSAPTPTPTATPTATPSYPCVELAVLPNIHGGYEFGRGDEVVLAWQSHLDRYGSAGKRMNVYLGAALDTSYKETVITVEQLTSSGTLYLFGAGLEPARYTPPGTPDHTWENVLVPEAGTIVFTVPRGAAGEWVFAAAFSSGGRYVATPPVVVSNQFTIR